MYRACLIAVAICAILSFVKAQCGDLTKCEFRWCKPNGPQTRITPRLYLRDPNIASNPSVCLPMVMSDGSILNKTVKVFKTGASIVQPLVGRGLTPPPPVRIDQYRPKKMFPSSLPKDYIYLREITFPPLRGQFGVARRAPKGNQEEFLNNLCVTLPLERYGIVNADGTVTAKSGKRDPGACVAFQSRIGTILIELTWNSADNFDLSVEEPNGNIVNNVNPKSTLTGANLVNDNNIDGCDTLVVGREQMVWNKANDVNPLRGEYVVRVKHTKSCNRKKATKWSVAVIINGKNVLFRSGLSKRDGRQVLSDTFVFSG